MNERGDKPSPRAEGAVCLRHGGAFRGGPRGVPDRCRGRNGPARRGPVGPTRAAPGQVAPALARSSNQGRQADRHREACGAGGRVPKGPTSPPAAARSADRRSTCSRTWSAWPTSFPTPTWSLEVLAVSIDEIRIPRRRWPGYKIVDRCLTGSLGKSVLERPADLWGLLPGDHDWTEPFTTADIARRIDRPLWFAQRVAYCLRLSGAALTIGRAGTTGSTSREKRRVGKRNLRLEWPGRTARVAACGKPHRDDRAARKRHGRWLGYRWIRKTDTHQGCGVVSVPACLGGPFHN